MNGWMHGDHGGLCSDDCLNGGSGECGVKTPAGTKKDMGFFFR
jgi:hypothetical protein